MIRILRYDYKTKRETCAAHVSWSALVSKRKSQSGSSRLLVGGRRPWGTLAYDIYDGYDPIVIDMYALGWFPGTRVIIHIAPNIYKIRVTSNKLHSSRSCNDP